MSQQYDNTNTGVLFINDKQGNDKRPDRKGSINIDGVDYWLSGWLKEGAKGPFLSLKVEIKEGSKLNPQGIAGKMNQQPQREQDRANFGGDDDINF
jgi:hypothetical protein